MARLGEVAGQRQCETCGKWFTPRNPRHTTCFDCFQKARAGGNRPSAPTAGASNLQAKFDAYLKQLRSDGYFDSEGNLRVSLRVEDADMVAQILANSGITTGQLRRFFTMARSLEQQLNTSGDFPAIVPEIASLQPFAVAVVGKEQNEAQRTRLAVLRDFIDENAQLARQSEQAFRKGFLPHFESVIAYFTFYKPK